MTSAAGGEAAPGKAEGGREGGRDLSEQSLLGLGLAMAMAWYSEEQWKVQFSSKDLLQQLVTFLEPGDASSVGSDQVTLCTL